MAMILIFSCDMLSSDAAAEGHGRGARQEI